MRFEAEHDTKMAALYQERERVREMISMHASSILSMGGAEFYYRRRQRVTDMSLSEAEANVARLLEEHKDVNAYARIGRMGRGELGGGFSLDRIRYTVEKMAACRAEAARLTEQIEELEGLYTGWSRFFLVTSSKGHIHSSMNCSTCRVTTRFGWLPDLSGRSEAECVESHGPALCSVCFPSAPVEWTVGEISKAQAEKVAA